MRTIIIVLGTAAAVGSFVYALMRGDSVVSHGEPVATQQAQASSDSRLNERFVGALLRKQATNKEAAPEDMVNRIAELEARLEDIETAGKDKKEPPGAEEEPKEPKVPKVTEADLGQWMDDALNVEVSNADRTNQASAELEKGVKALPGVNLEDVNCGERFCRATFARDDGDSPVLRELFGLPSIVSEGFTVPQPDGRVAFYFTPPGQALKDLKSEATAALVE